MSPGQIAYGTCREKLDQHGFELATLLAFGISGFNYLIDTDSLNRSQIGHQVFPFDHIWNAFYVVALLMVYYGLFRESQRFRVAGLSLFMFGLLMQFIAAVTIDPLELRDFVYLPFIFVAGRRAQQATLTVIPRGRGHDARTAST